MSNFHLCDRCMRRSTIWRGDHEVSALCYCVDDDGGRDIVKKRVMFDYHGKGGRRYDDSLDVCKDFKGGDGRCA